MARTRQSPKKVTSPGPVSPSRQIHIAPSREINSAPSRLNFNARLLLSKNVRKWPANNNEATTDPPTIQEKDKTTSTINSVNTKIKNDENCDSNNKIDTSKTVSATKKQVTEISKADKIALQRRHSFNILKAKKHLKATRQCKDKPQKSRTCLKLTTQLRTWKAGTAYHTRASSTTTEPSDKFYSAVSTRSSTVYYSPTEPNPTNSTVSFDRPNIHHEQKSKRQLPSDAIDYFDNNKGAWVYLKSMTAGIESYGLGGFTPENTVDPSGYLVGSNRECDIRIPLLDDRHFVIYNYWESDDSGGYSSSIRVVDRSTNGFFVDDYQIPKSMVVTIKDGQIIQLVGENIKDVVKFEICLPMPLIQLKTHRSKRAIADLYHFDKKEKFSSGNFGDVFRATCIKTNEVVALKRILLTGIPGHVFQSFFRELSVNLSLKPHPCIIRLKDYGEERRLSQYDNGEKRFEKILYMVLEFGQDRDLFYYVQDCYQHSGTIPEQDALCIFDQIFHATAYLHSQGIAHRDLKLENVIVINKAMLQVKLCDFGVSSYEQKFTPFVTCCGTQDYSAPELLAPGKNGYTKAVDIWSLGVMLYILLEGKTPYSGCNAKEEMIKRIKSGNFPCFNSDKWKYVSDQCKDLIKKMMTAEPRQRLDIGQVLSHPWSRYAEQLPNRNPSLISYLKK